MAFAKRRKDDNRDGDRFVALPYVVIDSPAYRAATPLAIKLLLDIARQENSKNNGALVACATYLKPRGWRSKSSITRALRELLELGLLVETRKGARPNRAAWFAITWKGLARTQGLDIDPAKFRRGLYKEPPSGESIALVERARNRRIAPMARARTSPADLTTRTIEPNSGARLPSCEGSI